MKLRLWITMIVLSLLLIGCTATKAPQDDTTGQLNKGDLAINFEFLDYDGNTIKLEDLKGEKVYLKFWASWCSICNAGLPELDELFVKDKDYTIYSVVTPNANGEKSIEGFKAWFQKEDYPNIIVLFDVNASFSRKLGVLAVPTSVYIGSDGVLIKSAPGHSNNKTVESFIQTFK